VSILLHFLLVGAVLFDSNAVATGLSRLQMRNLLMGADAFVLPTRGEGWGLPVMEAMAMALPVIVTNTSGCSQYLTRENSFPITPTPTPDGFSEPSVSQLQARFLTLGRNVRLLTALQVLMRKVYDSVNSGDGIASSRGRRARLDIMVCLQHH
jgi:glycosyltransferase involved in cell wall biosynthesis